MVLLEFFEDLSLVVLVLLFFMIYNYLKKGWAPSSAIALMVAVVIALLILIPYVWFRYVLFVLLILGMGAGALGKK